MATAIMKQKEVPEMDDVEEIISKISEDSPYKRRPTQKRTWMTVPEMGKLLGLKKTDRYWLVHKNVFESKEIAGKIRINIASFEKWYANQIKYHKVTGEEPGKELKSWSYSVKEVADLLGVDEYLVYDLLKKNQMEAVIVDYWKRIPKESFQNWYKSQSRYRTKEDREKDALLEDATITMPEMAQLLGTTRSAVYTILDNPKYSHFFEFIVIAEKKRITKESFQKFLEGQDRYKLDPSNDYEELAQEQNIALANFRRKKLSQTGIRGSNGNIKDLTFDEANTQLVGKGFLVNKTESYSDTVESGRVISQTPSEGNKAPKGSVITVTVSLGKEDTKIRVPNLIGLSEQDGTVEAIEAGLTVGSVTYIYSDEVGEGMICYQSYSHGSYVDQGTSIDIKVSQGAQKVTYKCNVSIAAPTTSEAPGYVSGMEVSIKLVTDDDNVLLDTKTSTFPVATNFNGMTASGGTLTMTYQVTSEPTTTTNPDTGEQVTVPGTTEDRSFTRRVEFVKE